MTITTAIPTVHLNGTSKQELLYQLAAARLAIQQAQTALSKAAPHGRDYYTQGAGAITRALEQHQAHMRSLYVIGKDLEEMAMGVLDQGREP